ncbi:uncharacterized protein PHACADRAFT_152560 [Phanerochaete carnosa HHB-10118-sp]|uniref:Uncharacterized protein n=1 Tax=Phanerochaete carnosa (strain HHB-10118-sp) TaxID=650164 RepID=K5VH07_PHACS|nr:uncharacterized protein PHACADRAFT_152560 [Phanerochaete carnosa HHB-10118-sp]EKM50508.1 hypothetical protein PHACADRAFT_152560 [Phanerochaete carnosa HHB-10118-sp]
MDAAAVAQVERIRYDDSGHAVMPMSRLQAQLMANQLAAKASESPALVLLHRRLKIHPDEWRAIVLGLPPKFVSLRDSPVKPLEEALSPPVNPVTLNALHAIKTTPYAHSFLSRMMGFQPSPKPLVVAVDWETRSPWMDLMRDIREHYGLMQ